MFKENCICKNPNNSLFNIHFKKLKIETCILKDSDGIALCVKGSYMITMDNILKVNNYKKCYICNNQTNLIDYTAEIRFCSKECQDKFWNHICDSINKKEGDCFVNFQFE